MLAEIYRCRVFRIQYSIQSTPDGVEIFFVFVMLISIPCLDDGSYRLIRFVVTLASWKAHIHKMFTPLFFGLSIIVLVLYCFVYINIYENACWITWRDFVFSIFPVCVFLSCCAVKQLWKQAEIFSAEQYFNVCSGPVSAMYDSVTLNRLNFIF